ncbi:MAG: A1 family peptidase [archaeon]|nr:A1 family peptidase [archaeon]
MVNLRIKMAFTFLNKINQFLILFTVLCSFHSVLNKLYLFPFQKIDTVDLSSDREELFLQLTNNSARVEFKIGSPSQTILLHASTDKSYTYVIGEEADIYTDEKLYKLYKHSQSSSYKRDSETVVFEGGFANGNYMKDTLRIGNEAIGDISIIEGTEFFLGFDLPCDTGIFGIGFEHEAGIEFEKSSIERQLKSKDLIENHLVFVHYTGEGKGMIGIGGEPKEYDNKFKNGLLHFIPMAVVGTYVAPSFSVDNITYNGQKIYTGIKAAKISLDYAGIEANMQMKEILDRSFFDSLIFNKICRVECFNKIYYYYCNKKSLDKRKLFTLRLFNEEWNKTFEINLRDLWRDIDEESYFLMTFYDSPNDYRFTLGEVFLRNYTFTMDVGNKLIGYYTEEVNDEGKEKKHSNKGMIIAILFSIGIIIILSLFLYRLWKRQPRKLRGTELEDTYEYSK